MRFSFSLALALSLSLSTAEAQERYPSHHVADESITQTGTGTLAPAAVVAAFESIDAAIGACQAHELAVATRRPTGRLVVSLTVGPRGGAPQRVRALANAAGSQLATCVLRAVRTLRFDPPSGGSVTTRVPIDFAILQPEIPPEGTEPLPEHVVRFAIDDAIEATGAGVLNPGVVLRTVRTRRGLFEGCFERVARRRPDLASGAMTVTFRLRQDGHVTGVRTTSTTVEADVGLCTERVIGALHVEPGPDGGSIDFAVHLSFTRIER